MAALCSSANQRLSCIVREVCGILISCDKASLGSLRYFSFILTTSPFFLFVIFFTIYFPGSCLHAFPRFLVLCPIFSKKICYGNLFLNLSLVHGFFFLHSLFLLLSASIFSSFPLKLMGSFPFSFSFPNNLYLLSLSLSLPWSLPPSLPPASPELPDITCPTQPLTIAAFH